MLRAFFIFLFLPISIFSQKIDLKFIPLENDIDSVFINKIQVSKDETLIKFFINAIHMVGGYTEATNYLCRKGKCRIITENYDGEIKEITGSSGVFKKLNFDFNKKMVSEIYAYFSFEFNSSNEEVVFDGVTYGIYIQQNSKSNTLKIYEAEYYKNSVNRSINDLAKRFYQLFESYFIETE